MSPTDFLKSRNIIPSDKTDLLINFTNGNKESLIELLDSYHKIKLEEEKIIKNNVAN